MKKTNVAVLMGGKSAERKISILSGRQVAKNLNRNKYRVVEIVISQDGKHWKTKNGKKTDHYRKILKDNSIDIVFIALHGPYGEDGTIQGFLESIGVQYTGSGVLSSAIGMDKAYSRTIFAHLGMHVPKYLLINTKQNIDKITKSLKYPLFVKPTNQGSSVGTSKVHNPKELKKALKAAFAYSDPVIVEEYLEGTEITCAILGNDHPKAFPLIEIVPKHEFFDLEAKYDAKLTDEICPARIDPKVAKIAQSEALKAYQALSCRAFGRVDMIISKGKVFILEVNTIPGLTPVSLLPKAAKTAGINYQNLLDEIISHSKQPK